MLGSTVLELTLGLCVFYIALSLICSGVTQYFSEWRQRRGRILVGILSELVNHQGHQGESILSCLLKDARIAGGPPEKKTKDRAVTNKEQEATDVKALVLPAGGRIDKFVFTETVLDLMAGKLIKATKEAAPLQPIATDAGTPTSLDSPVQLVQRLQTAISSIQSGITVSLSGMDLAKWDKLLTDIKARTEALAGSPLDDVNRQAEAILKELQIAATAEGQAETRARLLDAIGQETEAVLGLARRLSTARALELVALDMPDSPFRSFLARLANRGALEPEQVKNAIQDWYSSVNDRVSVEYRGKTQRILFVTALGVTLCLNADTLQMANRLAKDEALRKVVTETAVELAKEPDNAGAAGQPVSKTESSSPASPSTPLPGTAGEPAKKEGLSPLTTPSSGNAEAAAKPQNGAAEPDPLNRLAIPLRWTEDDWNAIIGLADYSRPQKVFDGLYKILGLVITALALTMGAEFWYNLLKQLVPALPGQKEDQPSRT